MMLFFLWVLDVSGQPEFVYSYVFQNQNGSKRILVSKNFLYEKTSNTCVKFQFVLYLHPEKTIPHSSVG